MSKKGILAWLKKSKTKPNVLKEGIIPPISEKKKIDTVNKTEKSKSFNKKVDMPRSNKTEKVKSIDKSGSTQRTDTENKVDKSRSIPRTNLSNKSTRIETPSGIDIHRDNFSVSILYGKGECLSSVPPDILHINCNYKINKNPDTSIIRKKPIKGPFNPSKRSTEITLTDVEKGSPK